MFDDDILVRRSLSESDFVSINASLIEETRNMFG